MAVITYNNVARGDTFGNAGQLFDNAFSRIGKAVEGAGNVANKFTQINADERVANTENFASQLNNAQNLDQLAQVGQGLTGAKDSRIDLSKIADLTQTRGDTLTNQAIQAKLAGLSGTALEDATVDSIGSGMPLTDAQRLKAGTTLKAAQEGSRVDVLNKLTGANALFAAQNQQQANDVTRQGTTLSSAFTPIDPAQGTPELFKAQQDRVKAAAQQIKGTPAQKETFRSSSLAALGNTPEVRLAALYRQFPKTNGIVDSTKYKEAALAAGESQSAISSFIVGKNEFTNKAKEDAIEADAAAFRRQTQLLNERNSAEAENLPNTAESVAANTASFTDTEVFGPNSNLQAETLAAEAKGMGFSYRQLNYMLNNSVTEGGFFGGTKQFDSTKFTNFTKTLKPDGKPVIAPPPKSDAGKQGEAVLGYLKSRGMAPTQENILNAIQILAKQ